MTVLCANLRSGKVDLHRMVYNQVGRTYGINFVWITAKFQYCISHTSKIDDRWYSSKIYRVKMMKHVEQLQNKLNIHKPCNITRAGLNDTSTSLSLAIPFASFQFKMFFTSFSNTWKLSQFLTADSSKTRIENGSSSVIENVRLNQLSIIYYFTIFISKS